MSRCLALLFVLSTLAASTTAGQDSDISSPVVMANCIVSPQMAIKRILESERPDSAKRRALAGFVRVGDSEAMGARRIGKPMNSFGGTVYAYESGLRPWFEGKKVEYVGYMCGGRFVQI